MLGSTANNCPRLQCLDVGSELPHTLPRGSGTEVGKKGDIYVSCLPVTASSSWGWYLQLSMNMQRMELGGKKVTMMQLPASSEDGRVERLEVG